MFKFLSIVFISLTPFIFGADGAEDNWQKALQFYDDAEKNIRKGANSEAIVLLNTAIQTLKEIQYDYPKWNSSLVRSRIFSVTKRIEDVEKLIMSSLSALTREQLLEKCRKTEVDKTKYSKAMMIFYDKLKDAEQMLKLKSTDLEKAQSVAGKKMIDQDRLERLSFENLKMKNSLEQKSAQIKLLHARIDEFKSNTGANKLQQDYEKKLLLLSEKTKSLDIEKQDFLAQKEKMIQDYKKMSFKYTEVTTKEKTYEAKLSEMQNLVTDLKKRLSEEEAIKEKLVGSLGSTEYQLELASKRLADFKARERQLMADISDLKKGKITDAEIAHSAEIVTLTKKIDHLRKVEIDMKVKLNAATVKAEKSAKLLSSYMSSMEAVGEENGQFREQLQLLKKSISEKNAATKVRKAQLLSMSNEVASLKSQLNLQSGIIESMEKELEEKRSQVKSDEKADFQANSSLFEAYQKSEQDLKDRLKFTEEQLSRVQERNKVLKKDNLLGDEEMIRKYVQMKSELQACKGKIKQLYKDLEKYGQGEAVIARAFAGEEKQSANYQKLQELLFKAQKAEKAENFHAALGLYAEALHVEPANFEALLRIGLIHYNKRHYQDASTYLKKAFYQEPDNEQLLMALGLSYLEQDRIELALSYLSRLVGLKPDDASSRLQLGIALQGLGWIEAAFEQLKKSYELDANSGEAAFNLALLSLALPEPKVKFAKTHYDRAIQLGIVRDSQLEKYFEHHKEN